MTGKELVLAAMECKEVERIPWVPFCGVHTGSLIGKDAEEYLKSADNIVDGITKAIDMYRPDGIPVIFDLQIEAEILGCDLKWSKDNPPAVTSHPLADGSKTLADLKLPTETCGRMPMVIEATKRLRAENPDIALYGLITGPFTLALHLLGADIFMMMFDDPEQVNTILDYCADVANEMSRMLIEAGCDIVAVVDPMTSQIGPDQFVEFCTVPSQKIFDYVHSLGAKGSFFVCGHAQNNIEVMCDTHCDNISIDENIPLDFVKDICQRKGVSFGGNIQLTVTLLLGTPDDNKVNAVECMDIGGTKGFILAPGCDMPYAAPIDNIKAIAEVVHDSYQQEVARELAKREKADIELLDLTGYGDSDVVKIDVITLDSEGCAPCQYMVEAVKEVAAPFGAKVEWREHKVKNMDGIQMMLSLGVSNIPTLCIDGEISFISRIPTREKLTETIEARIAAKGI